jgi:hypothetical protein
MASHPLVLRIRTQLPAQAQNLTAVATWASLDLTAGRAQPVWQVSTKVLRDLRHARTVSRMQVLPQVQPP